MHLQKIELATNNLQRVKAFYQNLLHFRVVETSPTRIALAVGHSLLCFVEKPVAPFYHFAFLIPSNKIEESLIWIRSKTKVLPFNEQSIMADFANWNAQAFYFHDYDQNILEFIAHHDLQNDSGEPFSAASVLSLCEIGIPVTAVAETCAFLNAQYQVPYYMKGPRLKDFAVMGDEEGLLIVTTINRGWLPTQRPAERHYLHIELLQNHKTIILNESNLPK